MSQNIQIGMTGQNQVEATVLDLEGKLESVDATADIVENEVERVERDAKQTFARVGSGVSQLYGIMKSLLNTFGVAIEGVGGAVLNAVFSGLSSLAALATAQLSNPFTAFLAVATFIATNAANVKAVANAVKIEREAEKVKQMEERVGSLQRARYQARM